MTARSDKRYVKPIFAALILFLLTWGMFFLLFSSQTFSKIDIFVLIMYVVLVFAVAFYYSSKSGYLHKDFIKHLVEASGYMIFSVILIMAGAIAPFQNMNVAVSDIQDNDFEVYTNPSENIVLQGFLIYYDAETKSGNLYFQVYERNESIYAQHLRVRTPPKTTIKKTIVRGVLNESEFFSEGNQIEFIDINRSIHRSLVNVSFSGDLMSGGRFSLYVDAYRTFSRQEIPMVIDLGKYECLNYCWANVRRAEPDIVGSKILLYLPDGYYSGVQEKKQLSQSFSLNTVYGPAEDDKEDLRALNIALMVAGLIFFVEATGKIFLLSTHGLKKNGTKKRKKRK